MRLFIAIDIPEALKKHIVTLQKKLIISEDIGKLTLAQEPHITLKFLGDVTEKGLAILKRDLPNVKLKAFTAKIAGNGAFPNEQYMRVAWLPVEPIKPFTIVQQQVENATGFLRLKREDQFVPHITLARIKFVKDREALLKLVKSLYATAEWKVTSFKLIKSELTPEGAQYTVLEEYKAQ